MTRVTVALLLLSACTLPRTRTILADPRAADVQAATVQVVDATGRDLAAPRPGAVDVLARAAFGRPISIVSAVDAFSAAAAAALRARGIRVEPAHAELPVLRITLLDFEIRNHDAAGAVAFVSATYVLDAGDGVTLWNVAERRLPIRLAGPDLTRSELARIADEAVGAGLASLPARAGNRKRSTTARALQPHECA